MKLTKSRGLRLKNLLGSFIIIFLATGAIAAVPPSTTAEAQNTNAAPKAAVIENSVVKVFSTVRYPELYKPWTKRAPTEVTGSGVVIEGKRILSNAHVVLYASEVQIQGHQAGDKISATVEAIAPDIDLSVLKLDDESFFDSHPPLPRAKSLPDIKDVVLAYGYPEGGTSLSITKGIVSRVEFVPYTYPTAGLLIQIDAAINPGNSGGPAVVGDTMIGLAFRRLGGADNIGFIIPCEEIDLFLQDIADGHYDGKPLMLEHLQTCENPALRPFLKLGKSVEGTIVHQPYSDDPSYPLKEWDLITRIGDTPIDDQGRIKISSNLRVHFEYLIQKIAKNGKVPLTVIRDGKEMSIELPVSAQHPMVIPNLNGTYPSYFVYGPLVFSRATTELLGNFVRSDMGAGYLSRLGVVGSPLLKRWGDKPAFPNEDLPIVASPFFPHRLTRGYDNPMLQVVKTINGIRIKNLNHLVEVLRDSKDEFIRIEFDQRAAETLVFPRAEMLAATDEILNDNGVRSQGSPDTMAIWNMRK